MVVVWWICCGDDLWGIRVVVIFGDMVTGWSGRCGDFEILDLGRVYG